jgi:uncharacterized membrane protein YeaQ/YmgE (transglycosylase-associated protein family)
MGCVPVLSQQKAAKVVWILCLILFGVILGIVARWVVPGAAPAGVGGDIIVGVVGSLIGGYLYWRFGHPGISVGSFVCALIGAAILLRAVRAVGSRPAV